MNSYSRVAKFAFHFPLNIQTTQLNKAHSETGAHSRRHCRPILRIELYVSGVKYPAAKFLCPLVGPDVIGSRPI